MPLEQQTAAIERALTLLTTDEADAIIGEPGDEYRALIQAAEAVPQLLWALALKNGVRKKQSVLEMWAQGQMMLLQLVHDAYALGVRRGRGEGQEEGEECQLTPVSKI